MSTSLNFSQLRNANELRTKSSKYAPCEKDWTIGDWMMALTGEVGELSNFLKKWRRGDCSFEEIREKVEKEFGDVQTYLDIVAMKLGIDLGQATVNKFNEVSRRINSDVMLNEESSNSSLFSLVESAHAGDYDPDKFRILSPNGETVYHGPSCFQAVKRGWGEKIVKALNDTYGVSKEPAMDVSDIIVKVRELSPGNKIADIKPDLEVLIYYKNGEDFYCGRSTGRVSEHMNRVGAMGDLLYKIRTGIKETVIPSELSDRKEDQPLDYHYRDKPHVEAFAKEMVEKMADSSRKGRSGWDDPDQCKVEDLADMLIGHLSKPNKGNFIDVADFCMMLHLRGADPRVLRDAYFRKMRSHDESTLSGIREEMEKMRDVIADLRAQLDSRAPALPSSVPALTPVAELVEDTYPPVRFRVMEESFHRLPPGVKFYTSHQVVQLETLLRDAFTVGPRKGSDPDWDAFLERVQNVTGLKDPRN